MRNIRSALLLTIAVLNGTARVVPQRSRAARPITGVVSGFRCVKPLEAELPWQERLL